MILYVYHGDCPSELNLTAYTVQAMKSLCIVQKQTSVKMLMVSSGIMQNRIVMELIEGFKKIAPANLQAKKQCY